MITGINRPMDVVDPLCLIAHSMIINSGFPLLRLHKLTIGTSGAPISLRELGIH